MYVTVHIGQGRTSFQMFALFSDSRLPHVSAFQLLLAFVCFLMLNLSKELNYHITLIFQGSIFLRIAVFLKFH